MIEFRQKIFSKEYDAARQLYVQLQRDHIRVDVIRPSELAAVLRGNNVVIERFTAKSKLFGKDEYVMYLKLGAKVKMPENFRLPQGRSVQNDLGFMKVGVKTGIAPGKNDQRDAAKEEIPKKAKKFSNFYENLVRQRLFGGGNGKKNKGPANIFSLEFNPNIRLGYESNRLLGNVIGYDKYSRTVILQFKSLPDAIRSLDVLPFGLGYKVYLLDS